MSFGTHLRVALTAALLLAVCQVVAETIVVAVYARGFVLSPYAGFPSQMYDFCLKLFLALPGISGWLAGGALDRFLGPGFTDKLPLLSVLVIPNLAVTVALGVVIGAVHWWRQWPARLPAVLLSLVVVGFVVHAISGVLAVHIPKAWTLRILARNAYTVAGAEGGWIAALVLLLAGGCAALLARLRPGLRWEVWAAAAAFACVPVLSAFVAPQPEATASAPAVAPGAAARVDNVILISIDSLRADRLGCYGNPRATSPAMDRLARQGVRFAEAMSTTSWTLPSHVSLLTGREVLSHGVITQADRLAENVPTLAESLRQAGFATGGIVSALFLKSHYGYSRGFDHYDDRTIPPASWQDELRIEPAPVVVELANKWLRERDPGRFFLFLHFWDVHYDYVPPPPYDSMFDPDYEGSLDGSNFYRNPAVRRGMPERDLEHLLALYDGEIRWVDDHIAQILDVLRELGVEDRTAVIVTADHGDEFFEHGFKGHQRTLYREVTQVPLIMRIPGIAPGQVVDAPVSLIDVMPTILELTAVEGPQGMDGVSLVPAFTPEGGEIRPDEAVYAWLCNPRRRRACQTMQHSASGTVIHQFQPQRVEFYGPDDAGQQRNLGGTGQWPRARQMSLLTERLNEKWDKHRGLGAGREAVEIDAETLERLRALGYAD